MMDFFAKTDKGQRRRMNQDYVFASDQPVGTLPNLFLLADGMGGHKAGDYASRYAVDELRRLSRRLRSHSRRSACCRRESVT